MMIMEQSTKEEFFKQLKDLLDYMSAEDLHKFITRVFIYGEQQTHEIIDAMNYIYQIYG